MGFVFLFFVTSVLQPCGILAQMTEKCMLEITLCLRVHMTGLLINREKCMLEIILHKFSYNLKNCCVSTVRLSSLVAFGKSLLSEQHLALQSSFLTISHCPQLFTSNYETGSWLLFHRSSDSCIFCRCWHKHEYSSKDGKAYIEREESCDPWSYQCERE